MTETACIHRAALGFMFGAAFCVGTLAAQAANGPLQLVPPGQNNAAPAAVATPATIDKAAAVRQADAWLNRMRAFSADFVQTAANGYKTHGVLYVERPGKMHFEYAPPAQIEVLADGTSVAVRNKKLDTQDMYYIAQTPLKFLLKNHIELARDTHVVNVRADGADTVIYIIDKATFGGTSRLQLVFDTETFALRQWRIVDPQGYVTTVALSNIDEHPKLNPALFVIPTPVRN
ncbi:MAG: outer membrane lipoprotein carrier protein LolA [Hyphomicrobiales bacterium]|nr:outer membrane lipoprotein carrier protein LolA [Hyphomicrobiales bacterium]